jgi:uncharacterized damage-inducible protein DinB
VKREKGLKMNAIDVVVLNFEEVRRRSLKVWRAIPESRIHYKTDPEAMSLIEQIRHVLEGEWLYMQMLQTGGELKSEETPWTNRLFTSIEDEIQFAEVYRKEFISLVKSFSADDLQNRSVDRSSKGYVRVFGDFLLRMAYHESIHAGVVQQYLRSINVPRALIWD